MKRLAIILREHASTDKCEKIWGVIFSVIIGLLCFIFIDEGLFNKFESTFYSILCSTLGILIGFTISTIAIFTTSSNKDIVETKDILSKMMQDMER